MYVKWAKDLPNIEKKAKILRLGWMDTNDQVLWKNEKFDQLLEVV